MPKEVCMGRPVIRNSPAHLGASRKLIADAMEEVHTDIPSTVTRADVAGAQREKMLRAIAFSKARAAGKVK
jgi:hypothetical protein